MLIPLLRDPLLDFGCRLGSILHETHAYAERVATVAQKLSHEGLYLITLLTGRIAKVTSWPRVAPQAEELKLLAGDLVDLYKSNLEVEHAYMSIIMDTQGVGTVPYHKI